MAKSTNFDFYFFTKILSKPLDMRQVVCHNTLVANNEGK